VPELVSQVSPICESEFEPARFLASNKRN